MHYTGLLTPPTHLTPHLALLALDPMHLAHLALAVTPAPIAATPAATPAPLCRHGSDDSSAEARAASYQDPTKGGQKRGQLPAATPAATHATTASSATNTAGTGIPDRLPTRPIPIPPWVIRYPGSPIPLGHPFPWVFVCFVLPAVFVCWNSRDRKLAGVNCNQNPGTENWLE
jgi:hypothetical protein